MSRPFSSTPRCNSNNLIQNDTVIGSCVFPELSESQIHFRTAFDFRVKSGDLLLFPVLSRCPRIPTRDTMYSGRRYSARDSAVYPSSVLYEHNNNHSYNNLSNYFLSSKNKNHSFHALNKNSPSISLTHTRHPYALSTSHSSSAMLRSCSNFIHRFSSRLKLQNNEPGNSSNFSTIREEMVREKEKEKENVIERKDVSLISTGSSSKKIITAPADPPVASTRKHLLKVPSHVVCLLTPFCFPFPPFLRRMKCYRTCNLIFFSTTVHRLALPLRMMRMVT